MKKFFLLFISLLIANQASFSQTNNSINWSYEFEKSNESDYYIKITATLDSNWHIYSTDMPEAPIQKTKIKLDNSLNYIPIGEWSELGKVVTEYDSSFGATFKYYYNTVVFRQKIKIKDTSNLILKGSINYMICNEEICLPPTTESFNIKPSKLVLASLKIDTEQSSKLSLWAIFIGGFLGGLAALFTPCVFPIIPMTVSFFTKTSKTKSEGIRNSILYALSIIIIYVSLGFLVSKIFGFNALNAMSTNVWFNIFFFIILFVFALSFLGAFEIVLPASLVNKVDRMSDKGGLLGIFFMAFTLSLVSFSCTGPIIGTLLFESASSGNISGPLWGMLGFSSALAIPFGLFAAFPGWMKSLPKSGSWLNSVKVSLGFIELALAVKFLSNADLVVQAGLITREIFLVIWISIFLMLSLYLLGKIKFKGDMPVEEMSIPRTLLIILNFAFIFYLIPGLWGAPLKLINGFAPPDFYSEWNNKTAISNDSENQTEQRTGCPTNIDCFHDYDEALKYSVKVDKPILIDFTGWACVNCRKMENKVWTDKEVNSRLKNDFIILTLYVDDQRELPVKEKKVETLGGKQYAINTIGDKWSFFQASRFKINSQPYYVITDAKENTLSIFNGYNPDVELYKSFLSEGSTNYKSNN